MTLKRARVFLIHWTLAVVAAALAFVVHLAMRGKTVSLGYELGKARQEQARLREVKRVHEAANKVLQTFTEVTQELAALVRAAAKPSPNNASDRTSQ